MEERHPIPQNVTGFQFKLIGDMTIRQFAYLAGNISIAYIFYLLPVYPIFKWPFVLFFVLFGLLLAFVPYQGRPLDRWILNFFKAVFASNQYVFRTQVVVSQKPVIKSISIAPAKEPAETPKIISLHEAPAEIKSQPEEIKPAPGPLEIPETQLLKIKTEQKELEKKTTERAEELAKPTPEEKQKIDEELEALLVQKRKLEEGLLTLKNRLGNIKREQTVKQIPKAVTPTASIPTFPQVPNLISGIVKDIKGNILPNILVEVKDEKGSLVRAFKTNKLGQFSAATQLENGNYILELEDPQNQFKFDRIALILDGTLVPPFEIKNLDQREELRRKLFSNPKS